MFKTPLHYKTLIKGELWQLKAPLRYEFVQQDYHGKYIKNREVIIPAGYVTDFYTIPKALQWIWAKDIFPPHPSVLHDYLLTHMYTTFTRAQANRIFYEAMKSMFVPCVRRELFYAGVSLLNGKKRMAKRQLQLASLGMSCGANGQPCGTC